MLPVLTKLIFGWTPPEPPPRLSQVCAIKKILTVDQARFIGDRFRHLLNRKQYVLIDCTCGGCLNVYHKDEGNRFYKGAWVLESETAQVIKALNKRGYVQATLDNFHLVPVKSLDDKKRN